MLRTLPKKMPELGRIRLGDQVLTKNGKSKRPNKLAHFRITSSNRSLLTYAASLPVIGGEVREWADAPGEEQQWELYTACNQLAVLIPTFSAVSVQYEIWSGGGCQRRCTGEFITHSSLDDTLKGVECQCPTDDQERAEQAKTGKACARILRLHVILPDLPGLGTFRLETKGYYATAELLGTLDMLQMAGAEHQIVEGVLRLEQRTVKRDGKGIAFAVPILWPNYTPRQLLTSAAQQGHLLMAPQRLLDAPAEQAKTLQDHISDLYGPPPPPAMDPDIADLAAQLEAVVAAHGGDVEALYTWAEGKLHKPRAQFTTDDLTGLLATVRERAKTKTAQKAPDSPVGETLPSDVSTDTPAAESHLDDTRDAWQREEDAERETQADDDGQLTL